MKTKLTHSEAGFKVGDIVLGTWPYYGVHNYFYKVVGFRGNKTIVLKHLQMCYDSEYASNSPLYWCAPDFEELNLGQLTKILNFAENNGFEWHRFKFGTLGTCSAFAYPSKCDGASYLRVQGKGDYFPSLRKWDGNPVTGCCD